MRQGAGRLWSDAYLFLVAVAGASAIGVALSSLRLLETGDSLATLLLLASLTELYPLVASGASSSLIAPVLFVAFAIFGWPGAVLAAAGGIVLAQVALRRSLRIIVFNASQYVLAVAVGAHLPEWIHAPALSAPSAVLFFAGYYLASNFLSHGYLVVRGDILGRAHLRALLAVELPSLLLSLAAAAALLSLHAVGDRVNPLGLAFFFLPFIGLGFVLRQAHDGRLYQQQVLRLVSVLTAEPAAEAGSPLARVAQEMCRGAMADCAVLLRLGRVPRVLAGWPVASEERTARTVARLARRRGGSVEARRAGPRSRLQSWYAVVEPKGGIAVVIGRGRPFAYFGQMRRLVRTAAGVAAALLEREDLLARRQQAMVTAERTRLAQTIHDTLAQDLAAQGMDLAAAEREARGERMRDLLRRARGANRQALTQVRDAIWALQPQRPEGDFAEAMRTLQAEYRARGFTLEVTLPQRLPPLSSEAAGVLRQGAAEAVRNAFKHAGGSASLRVRALDGEVVMQVVDEGRRHPSPQMPGTGLGLRLLGQEVNRCGGRMELRPTGEGTEFELRLPVRAGASA